MSEGLNRVTLLGNLCADPELRFTQGGQAVLNMRIATNESYVDKDKVRRDRTDYHSVVCWGKRGEALGKFLVKGMSLLIEGSLRTSSYDNKEGQKVYKTEVNANNVILTGGKRGEGGGRHEDGGGDDGGGGEEAPQDHGRQAPPPRGNGGGGYGGSSGGGGRSQGSQSQGRGGGHGGGGGRAPAAAPPADDGGYDTGGFGGDDDIPFISSRPNHRGL